MKLKGFMKDEMDPGTGMGDDDGVGVKMSRSGASVRGEPELVKIGS